MNSTKARRRVALPILAGFAVASLPAVAQQQRFYGATAYGTSVVGAYNPYTQAGPGQTTGRPYGAPVVAPYPPAYPGAYNPQGAAYRPPTPAPGGYPTAYPQPAAGQVAAYNPWRMQHGGGGYAPPPPMPSGTAVQAQAVAAYVPYGRYAGMTDPGANLPNPPAGPIRSRIISVPETGHPQGAAAPFQTVPYTPRQATAARPQPAPRPRVAAAPAPRPTQLASGGTGGPAFPPPTAAPTPTPRITNPPAKPAAAKPPAAPAVAAVVPKPAAPPPAAPTITKPPASPKPAPAAAKPPETPKPAPVAAAKPPEPPKSVAPAPAAAATPPEPPKPAAPPPAAAKPAEPPKPAPTVAAAPPAKPAAPPEPPKPAPVIASAAPPPPKPAPPTTPKPVAPPPTRVTFESNSPALSSDARNSLDKLAADLLANPDRRATLKAYSAGVGGPETRRLALARGLAVRAYLIDKGVPRERLDVQALGASADGGPADRVDAVPGAGT